MNLLLTLFCLYISSKVKTNQLFFLFLFECLKQNNSLPFNKYSFLTTHNAFAIDDGTPRNGVRALMLDTYDYEDTVWLCHSFGGECHDLTKFVPAIDTLKEVEAFLSANPNEIVTIILEDYKYWFPVTSMPKGGQDWPLVRDMVANNQRLLVFGSVKSKEQVKASRTSELHDGDGGMKAGECPNRGESSSMNDTAKSLVLVNYFRTLPIKVLACGQNNEGLLNMTKTCFSDSANRWANFLAVDFYKRSAGGGTFQAVDLLNGERLCGCNDVHSCAPGGGSCTP
ncbi:putative PLC-like phosphodiesterase, TIM beta/alpha-barrel domain superfamily [Helianthus annuus]|nr:putative PLC-like phosphodiesterase, TIM beta/alpha-barrel domain superfamily [Helianthus annuus]